MGGGRQPGSARSARRAGVALVALLAIASCDDAGDTPVGVVDAADAITAVLAWQAQEQEPVVDADGEPELPVIFVVAGDGAVIDIGVQADVAESTHDWANVRFADDVADTFDADLEGEPVKDEGAMLLVGPIPEPAPTIEVDLIRYTTVDDGEPLRMEITSERPPDSTDPDAAPTATVIAVTTP
jgi:hypothetical protein